MARVATLTQLRERSMKLANVESDASFSSDSVDALINLHLPSVYDILVAAGPADYYAADYPITVTPGVVSYVLPADFLSLVNVYVHESDDARRVIEPMQDRQRPAFRSPQTACSVTLEYIPACPTLTGAGTFDGVDGWDELISAKVARDILIQREGDVSVVLETIASAERRIRSFSTSRKRGGAKQITDVETEYGWRTGVQLDAYRLRGGNIELYASSWGPFG